MKIMVFSDTHGQPDKMLTAIVQASPDMIIHLGDGARDIEKIKKQFPQIPLEAVRGNCDLSSDLPESSLFSAGGVKIFITHGHIFAVKHTLSTLIDEGRRLNADIVLFGHTHAANNTTESGLYVVNPGSAGNCGCPSCAEIIIDDKREIFCRIIRI